jgi:hypothetical protein
MKCCRSYIFYYQESNLFCESSRAYTKRYVLLKARDNAEVRRVHSQPPRPAVSDLLLERG